VVTFRAENHRKVALLITNFLDQDQGAPVTTAQFFSFTFGIVLWDQVVYLQDKFAYDSKDA
jgi:hypothetical protein